MPSISASSPAPSRFAGLDGLRAIAVGLVVVYHLFPSVGLAGGFIGVDVFFVLSGFLITSLLLGEHARSGSIALGSFWKRRARRLVPALIAVITVCSTLAWLLGDSAQGGDLLVRIGWQLFGAITFSSNWVSLASGADYFTSQSPELFRNLWSLAVEEQFYLVWPLAFLLLVRVRRARWRIAITGGAAAASALWMWALVAGITPAGDTTRAYFGTDSHAFGLLAGVALAFAVRAGLFDRIGERGMAALAIAGPTALLGVVAIATLPETAGPLTFPGALLGASLLSVVVIAAAITPGTGVGTATGASRFGRVLDAAPLRAIGQRSYGIYLWHWPLLLIVQAVAPAGAAGIIALALTAVLAEASYRFVETPVRRLGFRASWRALLTAASGGRAAKLKVASAIVVAAAVLGGTTAAVAAARPESSAEAAVDAGAAALRDAGATPQGASGLTAGGDSGLTARPEGPAPSATPITGDDVTAVGDSVMLASAGALVERFPGIQIDASVSRGMGSAPGILRDLDARGELRDVVVVGLGTNGPVSPETLDEVESAIGPERDLVLVNAFAPRDWIPGVNDELGAFARAEPRVQLADWADAISPHEELLAGDRVHPGHDGGAVYAGALETALEDVSLARARSAEFAVKRAAEQQLRKAELFAGTGSQLSL